MGRHQAERVLNAEVPYVRYLIGWIAKKFDYINRVTRRFRFRSTRVCRHTLPLVAMHLVDRSCVIVRFFLKILRSQQPKGEIITSKVSLKDTSRNEISKDTLKRKDIKLPRERMVPKKPSPLK